VLTTRDGGNADIAGAIYLPSYLLFPVDDTEKPRHLYTRASLVSYRSLFKQISGRPIPPEIRA